MYTLQEKPDTHDDRAAAQATQVSSDAAAEVMWRLCLTLEAPARAL
jgi:hypothetical protein